MRGWNRQLKQIHNSQKTIYIINSIINYVRENNVENYFPGFYFCTR